MKPCVMMIRVDDPEKDIVNAGFKPFPLHMGKETAAFPPAAASLHVYVEI